MARCFSCVPGLYNQLSGLGKKNLTSFCKFYMALIAYEQGDTQIILKLANLAAEWRLRDVKLLRRLAEIEIFRYGKKIADVTEFHKRKAFYT